MTTYRPYWLIIATLFPSTLAVGQTANTTPSIGREAVRLSSAIYPEKIADETAYVAWIDQRGKQLAALADRTTDNDLQRRYRTAAINWALAKRCEPSLSRLLNAVPHPDDRSEIRDIVKTCLSQLATLEKSLRIDPPAELPDEPDDDQIDSEPDDTKTDDAPGDEIGDTNLIETVEYLTAFARAIEGVVSNPSDFGVDRLNAAALDLSFYLEDERTDVAAAALLWQAFLYAHSGKPERALRILPHVMSAPRPDALMHDCFARLLRCRYMIERGSYAAAWALLLTIEERSHDWFQSPRNQADAARSAIFLKLSICDHWPTDGSETERNHTTSWCESTAKEIRKEHFGDTASATLLRLQSAIPLVIKIPDEALAEAAPASSIDESSMNQIPRESDDEHP